MKDPRDTSPSSMSRKEFLRGFASLLAYSAPAVVVLQTLGCSTGTVPAPGDGGTNCSMSGTSLSCDSESISASSSPSISVTG